MKINDWLLIAVSTLYRDRTLILGVTDPRHIPAQLLSLRHCSEFFVTEDPGTK